MKNIVYYLSLLFFTVSCVNGDSGFGDEILFDVGFTGTKSAFLSSNTISSFGVSSCETEQFFSQISSKAGTKMRNEKVMKTASGWSAGSRYYYPPSGFVSFFAYAPFIDDETMCNDNDYDNGMYILTFTPSQDVSKQVDFCIAPPLLNKTKGRDAIKFNFRHTLSNISFYASYSGTMPDGCSLYVDTITVSGVVASGKLKYKEEQPYYEWVNGSERTSYSLARIRNQLSENPIEKDVLTELNGVSGDGLLFLLPQTTDSEAVISFVAGLYDSSLQKVSEQELSFAVPEMEWPAGGKVKYNVTIKIEDQYSLSIQDWSNTVVTYTIG